MLLFKCLEIQQGPISPASPEGFIAGRNQFVETAEPVQKLIAPNLPTQRPDRF